MRRNTTTISGVAALPIIALMGIYALIAMALPIGVIVVAIHFLAKVW